MVKNDIKEIEKLRRVSTANIYDVLGRHTSMPIDCGLTDGSIRCMYPAMDTMVGYACTVKLICDTPKGKNEKVTGEEQVLEYLRDARKPAVMVIQNLDREPGTGGSIGDCMAAYFSALGCAGCITNGGVRDVKEIEKMGFHVFANGPAVGYSHFRFVEMDTPVNIGGLVIYPGDLLAGDIHGIIRIPSDMRLKDLTESIQEYMSAEDAMRKYCRSTGFSIEGLCEKTAVLDHMRVSSDDKKQAKEEI
jgi:4-hydroxy-4-methyl-2-oxoglutarate aldolase